MASQPHRLQQVMAHIQHALETLRYGALHITVHDRRVVQIERIEKIRPEGAADLAPGGDTDTAPGPDQKHGGDRTSRTQGPGA